MLTPQRVADCIAAMKAEVRVPVTVKFRIGVVDRDNHRADNAAAAERFDDADWQALAVFAASVADAGADALIVHARKAVLGGWSPQDNRSVPPLRYEVVERLRQTRPDVPLVVNGGLRTLPAARSALGTFDGIMIGREAYHRPWLLAELQGELTGQSPAPATALPAILDAMHAYARRELSSGTRPHAITRHMLGLLAGLPGAKELRHLLSAEVQQGMALDEVFNRAGRIALQAA
jgi:tRNA-dihydrouridine synthase A